MLAWEKRNCVMTWWHNKLTWWWVWKDHMRIDEKKGVELAYCTCVDHVQTQLVWMHLFVTSGNSVITYWYHFPKYLTGFVRRIHFWDCLVYFGIYCNIVCSLKWTINWKTKNDITEVNTKFEKRFLYKEISVLNEIWHQWHYNHCDSK